jgi:cytoskeletal protein CcmA (bactofilin family)
MLFQQLDANLSAESELTIISAGLVVVGNVRSPGEIHLEGKVLGDVHSARLTIGRTGRVEGDIFAEHVAVFGEVVGKVSAHTVFVTSMGRVDGTLLVESLTLEPGGHFEGHCSRSEKGSLRITSIAADHSPITDHAILTEAAE